MSVLLRPGVSYLVAKSGSDPAVLTRASGLRRLPSGQSSFAPGETSSFTADQLLQVDHEMLVDVEDGTVVPASDIESILAGVNAAARRLIAGTTTTGTGVKERQTLTLTAGAPTVNVPVDDVG